MEDNGRNGDHSRHDVVKLLLFLLEKPPRTITVIHRQDKCTVNHRQDKYTVIHGQNKYTVSEVIIFQLTLDPSQVHLAKAISGMLGNLFYL